MAESEGQISKEESKDPKTDIEFQTKYQDVLDELRAEDDSTQPDRGAQMLNAFGRYTAGNPPAETSEERTETTQEDKEVEPSQNLIDEYLTGTDAERFPQSFAVRRQLSGLGDKYTWSDHLAWLKKDFLENTEEGRSFYQKFNDDIRETRLNRKFERILGPENNPVKVVDALIKIGKTSPEDLENIPIPEIDRLVRERMAEPRQDSQSEVSKDSELTPRQRKINEIIDGFRQTFKKDEVVKDQDLDRLGDLYIEEGIYDPDHPTNIKLMKSISAYDYMKFKELMAKRFE